MWNAKRSRLTHVPPVVPGLRVVAEADGSKSFSCTDSTSLDAGKFGKTTLRAGPPPRERSVTVTFPVAGFCAGMYASTPVRNVIREYDGSRVLVSLFWSSL